MINRIETPDDFIAVLECLVEIAVFTETETAPIIQKLRDFAKNNPPLFVICNKCRKVYPATTEYFDRTGYGRLGLKGECKKCRNAYQKKYYKAKREMAHGDWSPEYLAEVNRIRKLEGKPPLQPPGTRKPGRPKTSTHQHPPNPGEPY